MSTSTKPRVTCPACGRSTRPRVDGLIRIHDLPGRDGWRCPAGGRPLDEVSAK